MFNWLTEEPQFSIIIVVAAIVGIVGVFITIFRKKSSNEPSNVSAMGNSNVVRELTATVQNHSTQTIYTGSVIKGFTLEQFTTELRRQEVRLRREIRTAVESEEREKRAQLEIELSSVTDRLLNLQKSFEEEQKRRETALAALDKLQGEQPSVQIDKAKQQLIAGDPAAAEELFDNIIEIGSPLLALACYQSGQLAEGRVDYFKAMNQYRKAVNLEPDNPDYLLAVGTLARTLGQYQEALPWLQRLLAITQKSSNGGIALVSCHACIAV